MILSAFDKALSENEALRTGLVSHVRMTRWPLVAHSTGAAMPMTKHGTPKPVSTVRGPGIYVGGSDAMVVPGRVITTSSSGPLTVSFYGKMDTITKGTSRYIFGQADSGANRTIQFSTWIGDGTGGSTNDRVYLTNGYYNAGNGRIRHSYWPSFVAGKWFIFTSVFTDASTIKAYMNGEGDDAASYYYVYGAGNSITNNRTDGWGIGQLGEFTGSRMIGVVGEAMVHSRVLSVNEIKWMHNCFMSQKVSITVGKSFVSTAKPWLYTRTAHVVRPLLQVA